LNPTKMSRKIHPKNPRLRTSLIVVIYVPPSTPDRIGPALDRCVSPSH
jgi:hypothetical protein